MLQSHSKKNNMVPAQTQDMQTSDRLEINTHSSCYLVFDNGVRNIHWRKDSGAGKINHMKSKTHAQLTPCAEVESNWVKAIM